MLAIKALQVQGVPIPRCVMITEGDEESGSAHIETYIKALKERIGEPTVFFCLDSGALDYERIWLTNSLRGMLAATIRVDVITEGIHSGDASGIVPSPFRIVRQLLERIEDSQTGEIHSAFQVDIPPNRYKEMYDLVEAKQQDSIKEFPFLPGVNRVNENYLSSIIMRGWKAQMTVIGSGGLPECKSAGNVMLPFNEFRISIRLPPTKNPKDAEIELTRILTENPPYNAKVLFD
jgi:acetylornithine deacetylase/succinyl-diaminopimelate desuccinylase-like protein